MSQPHEPQMIEKEEAQRPRDISARGWMQIAKRVWAELKSDRVNFTAAGIAFYLMLAMVPALGAVMSVYGLVADRADVERQLQQADQIIPGEVMDLVAVELKRLAGNDLAAGWGLVLGLGLAFWGGSKAMHALVTSMNVAYGEPDGRKFVKRKSLELVLTVCGVFFVILVLSLLAVVPAMMAYIQLGPLTQTLISISRWLLMFIAVMTWLAIIYRFAPYRRKAKWRWVTWGSFLGALLWILASALLTWYTSAFGDYSKTYGSLGAIVLLLLWFYMTGYSIMLGAELNSEMELQTTCDTTRGQDLPMGERGAYVADHVADLTVENIGGKKPVE